MSIIYTILRSSHCRSTHHYFAVDAIQRLRTVPAQRLGNLLLKYHRDYLEGAKAPDNRYKDFQNHVIHVPDKNWGGAALKCDEWLETARRYLSESKWRKAAFACGVLSHYFTDPIMPLHTAHSQREGVVHRPMEWSIYKSYKDVCRQSQRDEFSAQFQFAVDEAWISKAVLAVAQLSHRHYERLIDSFELQQANRAPLFGFNAESKEILAELVTVAIEGWAGVLTRLADEISVELPQVSLRVPCLLAAIDIPLALIVRRIVEFSERRAVTAIIKEFQKTGTVERHLPAEFLAIRRLREKSRIGDCASNEAECPPPATALTNDQSLLADLHEAASSQTQEPTKIEESSDIDKIPSPGQNPVRSQPAPHAKIVSFQRDDSVSEEGADTAVSAQAVEFYRRSIGYSSSLVDAPSIGPKTAKRFGNIGIHNIGEFVEVSSEELAARLATRWITADLIGEWQDQARLVCDVPALSGYSAQLLVALDYRTAWQLRTANAASLFSQLNQFCHTSEGQYILRASRVPTLSDVTSWIESARTHARRRIA